MAIKTVVVLACTGGIDYTQFRDVNAVEAFVSDVEYLVKSRLSKLKRESAKILVSASTFLASYRHPSPNLNRHLDVLHELFDKAEMLESIYAMLVSGFSSMPKAQPLIQRVYNLILYTKSRVEKAMVSLSVGVSKYQPEYFAKCVQAILKSMPSQLPTHESVTPIHLMRVIQNAEGNVIGTQFSVYLCFRGLMDGKNYCHDKYHIVLSCVVDIHGKFSMNYSLQPTMLLPGKFRSKDCFTNPKTCIEGVTTRLREEGFNWGEK